MHADALGVAVDEQQLGDAGYPDSRDDEALIAKPVAGTLADYVSNTSGNGEVRVRVQCAKPKPSFYSSTDLLRVTYTP